MFKSKATKELEEQLKILKQLHKNQVHKFNEVAENYRAAAANERGEKWEYLRVGDISIDQINQYGYLGWELVSSVAYQVTDQYNTNNIMTRLTYFFKRRLVSVPQSVFEKADVDVDAIKKIDAKILAIEKQLS